MELRVDQFLITSDRYQYVLYELRKPTGAGAKNEESQIHLGYYTSIEPIFHRMLERGVKESTATDLKELIEVIRGQRLFIRKASNAIIEAILQMPRSELPEADPRPKDLNELIEEESASSEPDGIMTPNPKKRAAKNIPAPKPKPEPDEPGETAPEQPPAAEPRKQRGKRGPSLSDKLKKVKRKP